ncbi:PAS domain-containing sensor histidine kinase [Sandaracinus amylolyticus]|uniref:histidine kinase n=1 Tax=Sandaracinus amylolyticus TaxID=927083 RepID=A0A0F6W0E1_9BACT|nr:PAS domain-containing sensor histidine kinase [Sandaracinus amylolyticus]AKF04217.1 Sensory box histidine kinase/response regulator [Sandaracinus amylolyticus]
MTAPKVGADPLAEAQRRLLDALPERVLVCRLDGRVAWASALALTLLGRSAGELEGVALSDLVVAVARPPQGVTLLDHLLALPHGEGITAEAVHRSGTQMRIDISASRAGEGTAIVMLRPVPATDLATAVCAHDETYELVFEGAPVGIFHFDAEGVITACNDAFVRIIGSNRRILIGLRMETLPDPTMKRHMRQALSGQRAHYEGEYRSATGGKVTSVKVDFAPIFGATGRVVGGVCIAEDVTERVRAQEALRRSAESFRTLIESAPDAIAVHRGEKFLLVNPALVRLLGYETRDEVHALHVEDVLHADELDGYRHRVPLMLHARQQFPMRELRLRKKGGETITTEVATIAVEYEGGPAILAFARDVTERKALEARLAQADRMATVGTLAAGVAHEINNPLAYVMANLELMAKQLPSLSAETEQEVSFFREALAHSKEGCERVRVIVRDLRIFSRAEEDRRVPLDVNAVIESALNMAGNELRNRAEVVRELRPLPPVLGDEARLGQVVLNLLLNAAHAIPEGAPRAHTIAVATADRDECVEIRISDTGTGIPRELIGRIFEPFWTTKPVGVGTGLGLSIVHGIVRAHGGSIDVESEVGVGSTFRVLLPAARRVTAGTPRARPAPPAPDAPVRSSRILVIDDETRFGRALRASLGAHHDVQLATSGREGLGILLAGEDFDLVVCDLMMPDVSGMGIYDEIRRARPDLTERFVFMTGGAYTDQARAFFEHVTVPRLEKPFDVAEVERLLRRVQADERARRP